MHVVRIDDDRKISKLFTLYYSGRNLGVGGQPEVFSGNLVLAVGRGDIISEKMGVLSVVCHFSTGGGSTE